MKSALLFIALMAAFSANAQEATYKCPPCNSHCDELAFDKPGTCSHCNMPLVLEENLTKMKTIAFYLQDGVEVLDFAGPMEVFSYAGYEVFTVSRTKEPIKTQGIMTIIPDYSIEDAPKADILAFFGGNSGAASGDRDVISWLKSQHHVHHYLSVCTGAFVLAEAGILDGKTATTFHNALDNLESNYPEIKVLKNVRFVDNGNVITTAGISAGIDGALHLVAKLQGFNTARRTAYYMEYDKWVPGEGLILTTDNPYMELDVAVLGDYTGVYEFKDGSEVSLRVNDREQSLEVILGDRSYPLYYQGKDHFQDVANHEVTFERDETGNVTGYRLAEEGSTFYRKLK